MFALVIQWADRFYYCNILISRIVLVARRPHTVTSITIGCQSCTNYAYKPYNSNYLILLIDFIGLIIIHRYIAKEHARKS